jgi:uncharacterized protein (DUF58 family)
MTARLSAKGRAYLALVALGVLAALALRRPEPVVLVAPFAVALAAGLAGARAPDLAVAVRLETARVVEGTTVGVEVDLRSADGVFALRGALARAASELGDLPPGSSRQARLELAVPRWGMHALGSLELEGRDALGLLAYELRAPSGAELRADPRGEPLGALPEPARTRLAAGDHLARVRGAGLEPDDVRPLTPGDGLRDMHWRATARRGEPLARARRAERGADVVLFLDALSEPLARSVRAAASLAREALGRRDRVAVVVFGGLLDWVAPGSGRRQWEHVLAVLVRTEVTFTYVRRDLRVLPPGLLAPTALVLAVSPLRDARSIAAVADLRGRGFDLAVVEVEPALAEAPTPLVERVWRLERAAVRGRFAQRGVPVAAWREGEPLQGPVAELVARRRRARRAA